jgi:Na+/H+ antiporter NhaD/arsenite permease-like protein
MAANTASAVLVSSNPTNILVTGSFSLNYITEFTKWTILPSIIPAILNYPILLFMFRKKIPKTITPLTEDPWNKLRNRRGAIFFSSLMAVTLTVLVGTTFVPGGAVQVWMVTAPAGILAFLFDIFCDLRFKNSQEETIRRESMDPAADYPQSEKNDIPDGGVSTSLSTTYNAKSKQREIKGEETDAEPSNPDIAPEKNPTQGSTTTLTSLLQARARRFPGTTRTVRRLPIALLPFAMCEFILVRGLQQRGWITVFARGFANACTSPAATVFFFGFVCAAFLCPLAGTNIGATIILVEILRDSAFQNSAAVQADPKILLGAIYAVALGSNLGAFSYTFAGSLAGLLWRDLLGDKGVKISQTQFALVNLVPLIMQTGVGCAIILGQLYWFA